jgi:N-acetylglutamate synthase-like GNAT family acetyltransferase
MVVLRPARPTEAAALSALAMRSKAHWGYSAEYLALIEPVLTYTEEAIANGRFTVAEVDGQVAGFVTVDGSPPDGELGNLFIDPDAIGSGVGRRLWTHAVESATAGGFRSLHIEADPNAEGFYLRMGAERVGETPSTAIAGRMLPLLKIHL